MIRRFASIFLQNGLCQLVLRHDLIHQNRVSGHRHRLRQLFLRNIGQRLFCRLKQLSHLSGISGKKSAAYAQSQHRRSTHKTHPGVLPRERGSMNRRLFSLFFLSLEGFHLTLPFFLALSDRLIFLHTDFLRGGLPLFLGQHVLQHLFILLIESGVSPYISACPMVKYMDSLQHLPIQNVVPQKTILRKIPLPLLLNVL